MREPAQLQAGRPARPHRSEPQEHIHAPARKEPPMFFQDMLPSDAERQRFDELCAAFSDFFQDCNRLLITAYDIAHGEAAATGEVYHSSVLMLVRHVIESLDGVG